MLDADGNVWSTGYNSSGQLGIGNTDIQVQPKSDTKFPDVFLTYVGVDIFVEFPFPSCEFESFPTEYTYPFSASIIEQMEMYGQQDTIVQDN